MLTTDCSYSCADGLNSCGGSLAQNLYQIVVLATTTTTTTLTTTQTAITSAPQIDNTLISSSQGGSLFRLVPNSDMFFVANNIVRTSFEPNALKCGSVCAMNDHCSSFVFKTDRNCTLFVSNPNNTDSFVQSSISTLYLKLN